MATNRKTRFLAIFSALCNQSVIYRGCFSKGKGNSVQFANSHTVIPIWFVAKKISILLESDYRMLLEGREYFIRRKLE